MDRPPVAVPGTTLLLRPWTEADAPGLREAIDEDLGHLKPWLGWTLEEPATLEQTRARLATYVEQLRTGRALRFAIVPVDRPSLILGGVHVSDRLGPGILELGYWVRRSAARLGIATAAASRLVVHAFERPDVERVVVRCDIANAASAAMARSLGFLPIGEATAAYPDGTPRPMLQFEMDRESYHARQATRLRERAGRAHLRTTARTGGSGWTSETTSSG